MGRKTPGVRQRRSVSHRQHREHDQKGKKKPGAASKKKRVEEPTLAERLRLLKGGQLSDDREVASLAADLGNIDSDFIEVSEENYIEAKEVVEKLLDHPCGIVRYNSLSTLAYEWGACSRIGRIKDMASSDPDDDCRSQAVAALGSLFRGTWNLDILQFLTTIVTKLQEEEDVRRSAYQGVLNVLGVPYSEQGRGSGWTGGKEEITALKMQLDCVPRLLKKTASNPAEWSRGPWSTLVADRILLRCQISNEPKLFRLLRNFSEREKTWRYQLGGKGSGRS